MRWYPTVYVCHLIYDLAWKGCIWRVMVQISWVPCDFAQTLSEVERPHLKWIEASVPQFQFEFSWSTEETEFPVDGLITYLKT